MHDTALENGRQFFATYLADGVGKEIIDLGSQDVNGSLRSVAPPGSKYVGVDFENGKGVDVILTDPYILPFEDGSVDVVVSSSCFEHSEFFWLIFLEVMRILKPAGLFYLNVPSNGPFHRYPVDCWRFYPDSGRALVKWAQRNGIPAALLESYTSTQIGDQWNDFVAVFIKEESLLARYPERILAKKHDYNNGFLYGRDDILRHSALPEDKKKMAAITQIIANKLKLE